MSESRESEQTPESQAVANYAQQLQAYVDTLLDALPESIVTQESRMGSYDHGPGVEITCSGYAQSFLDGRIMKVSRVTVRHADHQQYSWDEFEDLSLEQASQASGRHVRSWVLIVPDNGRPKLTKKVAEIHLPKGTPEVSETTVHARSSHLATVLARLRDSTCISGDALEHFSYVHEQSSVEKLEALYKLGRFSFGRFFRR